MVTISPVFKEGTDNRRKLDFEKQFHLHKTQDWIEIPEFFVLNTGWIFVLRLIATERSFRIKVDPSKLEQHVVNYGEVWGIDAANPGMF